VAPRMASLVISLLLGSIFFPSFFLRSFLVFLTSICTDFSLVKICRGAKLNAQSALLLMGTSYVMVVFQMRPFSNSAESVILALSLAVLLADPDVWHKNRSHCSLVMKSSEGSSNMLAFCCVSAGNLDEKATVPYGLAARLSVCPGLLHQNHFPVFRLPSGAGSSLENAPTFLPPKQGYCLRICTFKGQGSSSLISFL